MIYYYYIMIYVKYKKLLKISNGCSISVLKLICYMYNTWQSFQTLIILTILLKCWHKKPKFIV